MNLMKIKTMALLAVTALALTGCNQPGNEVGKVTEKATGKTVGQKGDREATQKNDDTAVEVSEESTFPNEQEMKKVVKESKTLEEMVVKLEGQGKLSDTAFAFVYVSMKEFDPATEQPDVTFYPMDENYFAVYHKKDVIWDEHKSDLTDRNWTRDMINDEYGEVIPPISD